MPHSPRRYGDGNNAANYCPFCSSTTTTTTTTTVISFEVKKNEGDERKDSENHERTKNHVVIYGAFILSLSVQIGRSRRGNLPEVQALTTFHSQYRFDRGNPRSRQETPSLFQNDAGFCRFVFLLVFTVIVWPSHERKTVGGGKRGVEGRANKTRTLKAQCKQRKFAVFPEGRTRSALSFAGK